MAATDLYEKSQAALTTPLEYAFTITPHATDELDYVTRAILATGAGDVEVVLKGDSAPVVVPFAAGEMRPLRVKRVISTNTTAIGIIGFY